MEVIQIGEGIIMKDFTETKANGATEDVVGSIQYIASKTSTLRS